MKLIIAGSRDLMGMQSFDYHALEGLLYGVIELFPDEIVSGCSGIIDNAAIKFAGYNDIKLSKFPADWTTHGKAAGPIRNRQMAEYGDALLLIWDGNSRGSASMLNEMEKLNKPVYEVILRKRNEN